MEWTVDPLLTMSYATLQTKNWMKKSQHMPVWLSKNGSSHAFFIHDMEQVQGIAKP
jgi:hypothetical protein